jgi:acetyl-CoA carboxylase biotin carboxyl carrier protein
LEPKDIHDLIEILSKSNLSQLEIENEGFKLKLVKKYGPKPGATVVASEAPVAPAAIEAPVAPAAAASAPTAEEQGLFEQKTPFVGTFYQAPSPDADPFVEVGTRVKKGQTLCIVEAMKLMNEIECEQDGEIVAVLVENGQTVEYGDPLFHIRPA